MLPPLGTAAGLNDDLRSTESTTPSSSGRNRGVGSGHRTHIASASQATARSSRAQLMLHRDSTVASPRHQTTSSLDTSPSVNPPHRSIFSSGPPTSFVSAESAHASMSTGLNAGSFLSFPPVTPDINRRNDYLGTFSVWPQVQHVDADQSDDEVETNTLGRSSQDLSHLFVSDGDHLDTVPRQTTQQSATQISQSSRSLTGHLFDNGFVSGRHSDITITAFGQIYKLHKIILDQSPFFSEALSEAWAGGTADKMILDPQDMDENITQGAFEVAIKRLYGTNIKLKDADDTIHLLATALWLSMDDLLEQCLEFIVEQLTTPNLAKMIQFVTDNDYGPVGSRILNCAKAILYRLGHEMPQAYWAGIPADIVKDIIGGDAFYIASEWDRWYLAAKILNTRLKVQAAELEIISESGEVLEQKPPRFDTAPCSLHCFSGPWVNLYASAQIAPLLALLKEHIHYVHLRFEQLQFIKDAKDVFGQPLVPESTVSSAMWMQMALRQKILNSQDTDTELDLTIEVEVREEDEIDSDPIENGLAGFRVPDADISYMLEDGSEAIARLAFSESGDTGAAQRSHPHPSDEVSTPTTASPLTAKQCYSTFPPFRFSVEFPSPRTLKEKKKVYSQTVWYAGSLWNLYITRVVTGKGQKLGVYLHRAKNKEDSDAHFDTNTVTSRINQHEQDLLSRRSRLAVLGQPTIASGEEQHIFDSNRSTLLSPSISDLSLYESAKGLHASKKGKRNTDRAGLDASSTFDKFDQSVLRFNQGLSTVAATIPTYTDPRTTIKTYFKIYSPSRGGKEMGVYESRPDHFTCGKSWGWLSSLESAKREI